MKKMGLSLIVVFLFSPSGFAAWKKGTPDKPPGNTECPAGTYKHFYGGYSKGSDKWEEAKRYYEPYSCKSICLKTYSAEMCKYFDRFYIYRLEKGMRASLTGEQRKDRMCKKHSEWLGCYKESNLGRYWVWSSRGYWAKGYCQKRTVRKWACSDDHATILKLERCRDPSLLPWSLQGIECKKFLEKHKKKASEQPSQPQKQALQDGLSDEPQPPQPQKQTQKQVHKDCLPGMKSAAQQFQQCDRKQAFLKCVLALVISVEQFRQCNAEKGQVETASTKSTGRR